MRQALGWQDGDGQLAAFVADHPCDFAIVNLSSQETQHKLRLLSEVVGVSAQQCLRSGISYLNRGLEGICARYMLVQVRSPALMRNCVVFAHRPDRRWADGSATALPPTSWRGRHCLQERAPRLLYSRRGEPRLSWISNASTLRYLDAMGMTRPEYHAFVREWPHSEEGRHLLEGLRWVGWINECSSWLHDWVSPLLARLVCWLAACPHYGACALFTSFSHLFAACVCRAGSVEGWPRPVSFAEVAQRQQVEAEQRQQTKAVRRRGAAAAMDDKRQGRGQSGSKPHSGGPEDGTAA